MPETLAADLKPETVPCAICGGTTVEQACLKFGQQIARCQQCRLVFVSPRLPKEAIWQRYSAEYFWKEYLPALGVVDGHFDLETFDARHAGMLDLVRRERGGAIGRLLEVGAGAGFFLKAAERAGWIVRGVELSAEGAAFATSRLGLDVRREPAETIDFGEARFDVAVMFDVVEHLFEPTVVLAAIRRLLVPGGLLVVTTPNFDALSRIILGRDWAVLSPLEHLYYYTERTLAMQLECAGFADVRSVRRHPSFGPVETMNYHYTHAPTSLRAKAYGWFVDTIGSAVYRRVQAAGRGDQLLSLAHT
jgi:2-polyprenyl-3-methyl-5-hydroxy-6-metoxy-1,4-benzoquinol methylase